MWHVQVAVSHVAFWPRDAQSSLHTMVASSKGLAEPFAAAAALPAQLTSAGWAFGGTHLQSMLQSSLELAHGVPSSHCSPASRMRLPQTGELLKFPFPMSWPMQPA